MARIYYRAITGDYDPIPILRPQSRYPVNVRGAVPLLIVVIRELIMPCYMYDFMNSFVQGAHHVRQAPTYACIEKELHAASEFSNATAASTYRVSTPNQFATKFASAPFA